MFSGPSRIMDIKKIMRKPVLQIDLEENLNEEIKETGLAAFLVPCGEQEWKVYRKIEDVRKGKAARGYSVEAEMPIPRLLQVITANTDKTAVVVENKRPLGIIEAGTLLPVLWQEINFLECQMSTLMDTVHEAITMIDKENNVIGWNRRAEELYQIPCTLIMGQNIAEFFSSLVVTNVINKQEVRDAYHQPRPENHVLINARPIIYSAETILGSVCSERDITETVNLHNELSKASSQVDILKNEIKKYNGPADAFAKIYGHSKRLLEVIGMAKRVATTSTAVLIRGESGTGKELFAESIHNYSSRRTKPFIVINCAAVPPTLFESELFGYNPGAFTGADKKGKPGTFELAHNGTVFLDEIGELQPEMQVKLLRILQNQHFYRVGGSEPIKVDVRVIAATNRNLESMIQEGTFREDLYYRLNVVSVEIPPLRKRKEDIPELVYLFTREFCSLHNRNIVQIEPEVMNIFLNYAWPGNIRELRNVIERMVIMAENNRMTEDNLPVGLKLTKYKTIHHEGSTLIDVTDRAEKEVILQALDGSDGNKSKAAKILGIPRSTLYYKMKKLGVAERKDKWGVR
ncbi:MAG: sigma-54 interaction domain-containing protein [Peptococcaceae bacterium]